MTLKVFQKEDLSCYVTKSKDSLPAAVCLGQVDADKLIQERDYYIKNFENLESAKWIAKIDRRARQELIDLGWYGDYYQKPICKINRSSQLFNEYIQGIGEYTKQVLDSYGPFHRPRYVFSGKNWSIKKHVDWNADEVHLHGFRIHIMLKTDDSNYCIIEENGEDKKYNFAKGEVWFLNVTYPHAISPIIDTRESISFDILSDKIIC